jgi:HAD superfamily hydrolase (TIGR01549 family)
MAIAHVIFDGFGTLVERQRPMAFYAHMKCKTLVPIEWAQAMTTPLPWTDWANSIGKQQELMDDLDSIVPYSDVTDTLRMLDSAGIGFSVMSNLASCYGDPLQRALSLFRVQHWFFSYADGMKKPDPRYYAHALNTLNLSGAHVLFVGDHAKHDVMGPSLAGLNALRVRRSIISMSDMLEPWC